MRLVWIEEQTMSEPNWFNLGPPLKALRNLSSGSENGGEHCTKIPPPRRPLKQRSMAEHVLYAAGRAFVMVGNNGINEMNAMHVMLYCMWDVSYGWVASVFRPSGFGVTGPSTRTLPNILGIIPLP